MATLKPFRIVHPRPDVAAKVCTLPYDVMSTDEARAMAEGNPLSFLRVTRSEIEFGADENPYSDKVYQKGRANLEKLIAEGALIHESEPALMVYRLRMGMHTQTGIVAAASCAEYDKGIIKKHELTRPDKEDDRTRHIEILGAQTGPVFLTYRQTPAIDQLIDSITKAAPEIDFTAEDGVQHTSWIVRDARTLSALQTAFAAVPALYVADGHHRSAAASRVAAARRQKDNARPDDPSQFFLTVTFPHDQVRILPYNRAVKDLAGHSPDAVRAALAKVATQQPVTPSPTAKGDFSVYLEGAWTTWRWLPETVAGRSAVDALDVSVLQDKVLAPLFGIADPRVDKRIAFVGGIRGTGELEKLVNSGQWAIAFSMVATSLVDLMTIADQDGLMPPKSTWFEPKLRDAMAVHLV